MCSAVLGDITNNYLPLPHYLHFRAQCGAGSLNIFYTQTETDKQKLKKKLKQKQKLKLKQKLKTDKQKQKNWNRKTETETEKRRKTQTKGAFQKIGANCLICHCQLKFLLMMKVRKCLKYSKSFKSETQVFVFLNYKSELKFKLFFAPRRRYLYEIFCRYLYICVFVNLCIYKSRVCRGGGSLACP